MAGLFALSEALLRTVVQVGDVGLFEVVDVGDEGRGQGHALGDGAAEARERLTLHRSPLLELRQRRWLEPHRGQPAYQTQINQALREYMEGSLGPDGSPLSDKKVIAHLAERIARYSAAQRKKKAARKRSKV